MNEFTNNEITKLDEILKFLNDNKRHLYELSFLADKFEISKSEYEFLYQKIIAFSIDEHTIGNILDRNTRYPSIECNYSTDRFIQNGGFEEYFKKKKELEQNQSTAKSTKSQTKIAKQKINAKNVIINNGNADSVIQNSSSDKKTRWDIIGIIGIILTTLALLFGDNLYEKIKKYYHKSGQKQETEFVEYSEKLNVPYLESKPILDKGLFFQQYYGSLLLGGPNLNKIEVNARKENGEKIEIKKDENGNLTLDIFENPYIEFLYKKEYYSMEIRNVDLEGSFECYLKKIKVPTLNLIQITKI